MIHPLLFSKIRANIYFIYFNFEIVSSAKKCATRTTGLTFVLKDDSDSDIEWLGAVQEEYETVDTANSGMHTNDQQNQPDELGRVLGQ